MINIIRRYLAVVSALTLIIPIGEPARGEEMDDYRLEAGDVLELSSATVPEMRSRLRVQMDGGIAIPLVGRVEAAGQTLTQVQKTLHSAFAAKVLRQRGTDGREIVYLVQPHDVVATIAELRPIYVTGDVSRPGEQTFRPGMTVRQAVVVAGGLDVGRYRATHPVVEATDLKGEHEGHSIELVKRRIAVWRLRRELGGNEPLDDVEFAKAPIDRGLVKRLLQTERNQLDARNRDYQAERDNFATLVRQADQQIAILTEQRSKEEQGREADTEELKRAQELLGKGALTTQRVTEARRAVLLSATRRLQTDAQLAQLQKQRAETASSLDRIEGQRRIRLNQELVEAEVGLTSARTRVQALGEKIQYVGLLRSSLRNTQGGGPDVHVVRRATRISTHEDFVLVPGDVIEIELKLPADRALTAALN